MGPLGWQETVFIFVLALLLFGPKKLPELGKTIGKALTEFRRASNELKSTFDREMHNLEQETKLKETAQQISTEVNTAVYDGSSYDYNYYDGYDGYQPYEASSTASLESTTSSDGASAVSGADSTSTNGAAPAAVLDSPAAESLSGEIAQVNGTSHPAHQGVEGTVAAGISDLPAGSRQIA
jgi:TatA/E family protein of Tat protein translocase